MPGSYCTNAAVAALLGLTLTASQQSEADTLILAASAYIERETRRAWLVPPITGEQYPLITPTVYLRSRPVASIQQVRTRTSAVGDTFYTAIAGVDYELFDPALGVLRFSSGYGGPSAYAFVDYTPALSTVPADIALAATLIVAETLARALFPGRLGIKEAEPERGVRLVYSEYGGALSVPPLARQIIDGYTRPII
jgi:hypothetical protein